MILTRRKLLSVGAGALILPYGMAARAASDPQRLDLTTGAWGSWPMDGSDQTATWQAAHAAALANSGNTEVYYGPGTVRVSGSPITLSAPFYSHVGEQNATVLVSNFQGSPLQIGSLSGPIPDSCGVKNINFAAGVTQTSGAALAFNQHVRGYYENVQTYSFYDAAYYGVDALSGTAPSVTASIGKLKGVRLGFMRHGLCMGAQAGLIAEDVQISSSGAVNGAGVLITGNMDGFFPDDQFIADGAARAIHITTAAGNAANIRLRGAYTNFTLYGLHVDLSGTGGVNGLSMDNVDLVAALYSAGGIADAVMIQKSGTGSINVLDLNARIVNAPQRAANVAAIVNDARFRLMSTNGGNKSAGSYSGMDFGGLAHVDVTVEATELQGVHSYGVQGHRSIVGGLVNDGVTAPGNVYGLFGP